MYLAQTEGQGHGEVVLKMPPGNRASRRIVSRYENEYQVLNHLDSPLVVRPVELVRDHGGVVLVLEAATWGKTLSEHLGRGHLSVVQALKVGLLLFDALEHVHANGVVHLDLSPNNVIVNDPLDRLMLIDFGLASMLPEEAAFVGARSICGTLAYLSPEQTGRMNRVVDYRSDYYSAGGLLYHALTGRPAFASTDPMDLVYSHIARKPTPPREHNELIPTLVSDLVLKLLEKAAEDRYQNGDVLRADLRRCIDELEQTGTVEPFELAAGDRPPALVIPQKLFGRDAQVAQISEHLDQVAHGGTHFVLVSGHSGIGKTALVQESWGSITKHRGGFAQGKFDQFNRATPYSGLVQAFGEVVRQLMTEPEEVLESWKSRINKVLLGNGQLLIDVIPELQWLIGAQAEVPVVGSGEAQNRFNQSLLALIGVLASPSRPMVLFLDDLQWVDRSTLSVIELLLRDSAEERCLLLLGAYRSNEVDPAHPLIRTVADLKRAGRNVASIDLQALAPEETCALVRSTLGDPPGIADLSGVIHDKTSGNPFFVLQFLTGLAQDGLLERAEANGEWTWSIGAVKARIATQNVVEVLLSRLRTLSPETQGVLRVAACLGSTFDLQTLATVGDHSLVDVTHHVREAARAGFVTPLAMGAEILEQDDSGTASVQEYRFLHDQVQQAADGLLEDKRLDVHLAVGRRLLANTSDGHPGRLFAILDHLNVALHLIDDPEERLQIARLNLEAGLRAKRSTAFHSAVAYLRHADVLLPERPAETQHAL
ncbi:MAG: AAA family ATPase, partial [Rhodobacterales bacterium]|nr:AAA family ATPase [Rhodobacterales bacterium]